MSAQNAIDLSKLPSPEILFQLDYDALLAELIAQFRVTFPDWQALPSDPVLKAFEISATARLNDRQAFNERSKQSLVAYASGSNLDHLAANLLITRLPNESDDNLRARVVLSPEGYSTAGPEMAYVFHAKSAHSEISDVRASSPEAGKVVVAVLPIVDHAATLPNILAAVNTAVNSETVRPMTDWVETQAATLIDYDIEVILTPYLGPDTSIVLSAAQTGAQTYVNNVRKIGHDVTHSMVTAAVGVPGVQKSQVLINGQVQDLVISETECGNCTGITITIGGVGE
jgi:phage-related baseplate assembly protein